MNPSTIVAVHAYSGDEHQVRYALPQYLHHECPVLVLSPQDAPAHVPGATNLSAGMRAYEGLTSVDRQRQHIEILLRHEADFFLLHDSDSICLSPELPSYLYDEPDTVFFNGCSTDRYLAAVGQSASEFSVVAQPPIFCSRTSLEKMYSVANEAAEMLPPYGQLIDWYWIAMATCAGLKARSFPDGVSRPIWHIYEAARVYTMVRTRGVVFVHSVKHPEIFETLVTGRADFLADPEGQNICAPW